MTSPYTRTCKKMYIHTRRQIKKYIKGDRNITDKIRDGNNVKTFKKKKESRDAHETQI